MKKITLLLLSLFISATSFAQDTEAPTAPTNLNAVFYQNSNGTNVLYWDNATDNVAVTEYDVYVDDTYLLTVPHISNQSQQDVTLENLFGLFYCFYVVAKDAALNVSSPSNTVCFYRYPDASDQYPVDLYLSAIVNGLNNNKIIEVSNLSNGNINLDNYSIKVSRDGNPTWQDTYNFPSNSMLSYGSAFVIGRSTGTFCSDKYDVTDDIITNFDGNDVIGLFKNNILIQSFGALGDGTVIMDDDFAYTLSAVGNLITPSFDVSLWNANTITSGIGSECNYYMGAVEYVVLSVEQETQTIFSIYPNPTNGNTVYINTKNNVEISSVRVFDITGKQVINQTNPSNEINVQGLQQGMYILQLQIGNQKVNKKLIKQ